MEIEKTLDNKSFFQNLKNNIFPDIAEDGSIIVDYFIRIMFFLYPLFLVNNDTASTFSDKIILFAILLLLSGTLYGYILFLKRAIYSPRFLLIDVIMLFVVVILIVKAAYDISLGNMDIKQELFFTCVIGSYFLTRAVDKGYMYYLNLLLYSAVILYIGLFKYYFVGQISLLDVEEIVLQPEGLRSYLIMTSSISVLLYCLTEKVQFKFFYVIMATLGFILILLDGDAIGVCITGFFILLVPMVFMPTAELIKRNLTLLYLYLFLVSNVPLLQYVEWFKNEQMFDIQNGLYIDLLLILMGIFIYIYWKKVPEKISPEKIIMKRFRRFYKSALAIAVVAVAVCILTGNKVSGFPDIFGMKALKEFCASLSNSVNANNSFFSVVLESYGVIGGIISIILVISLARKLWKQINRTDFVVKILSMLACLFLIQNFFYQFQPISTPLYIILLTLALFAEKRNNFTGEQIADVAGMEGKKLDKEISRKNERFKETNE